MIRDYKTRNPPTRAHHAVATTQALMRLGDIELMLRKYIAYNYAEEVQIFMELDRREALEAEGSLSIWSRRS